MIYNKKYVKELIRKHLINELTVKERKDYKAVQMLYTEEEMDSMIAEVLMANKDSLKEDELEVWNPNFELIRSRGQKVVKLKAGGTIFYLWACALLLLCLGAGLIYRKLNPKQEFYFIDGACAGLGADAEIPISESAATLTWGDSLRMYVASEAEGELLRDGRMRVRKKTNGIVELAWLAQTGETEKSELKVSTGPQEQCVLMLPDSTWIRLQANTILKYRTDENAQAELSIRGQVYVQRPSKELSKPLIIHTLNGRVLSLGGDFVLQAEKNWTKTALGAGRMKLFVNKGNQEQLLDCYGAEAYVLGIRNKIGGEEKDSLIYDSNSGNYAEALRWTKALRTFKDIPLRQFTREMGKWYGFEVANYACIPADKRITATICYREGREAAFAAIRTAGVRLYEADGRISFCPEDVDISKADLLSILFKTNKP